ncbi:MAG: hypothetical protein JNL70_03515 [Saprospiraceae bacterium]|nr:hypothetical protein [Saprospiraceae bacterium]
MFNTIKVLPIYALLFCWHIVSAQEQLGLRLGNYAGISGITLNPTAGINNPLGWDVNVVSAGSFIANDFAFVRDASVLSTYRNLETIGPAPETKIDYPIKATKYIDFYNRPRDKYFSTTHFVTLPSVQINLASGHSFGLFVGQRAALVTREIPIIADPYVQQNIPLGILNKVPPMLTTGMTWGELGVNYAYQMGDDTEGGLSLGINAKILSGNQGFFVQNNEGTALTRLTKDSTRVDAINLKAGFTNNFISNPFASNGLGLGVDIGAQFTLGSGESDERPYLFRVNAAILDLGRIRFHKNTEIHALQLNEPLKMDTKDYLNLNPNDPIEDALLRLNQKLFGKADSTYKGNYFPMSLPTAFSLQGDIAITEQFYVNGLLVQRIPISHLILSRDNIMAITPRFDSRWFGAMLPLSILNYQEVRMGLAVRLAFLTIGTDHLLSFLGQKELNGTDIYVALKVNAFTAGKLGDANSGYGRRRGGQSAKCYRF